MKQFDLNPSCALKNWLKYGTMKLALLISLPVAAIAQQNVTYSTYSGQPVITAPGSITFTDGFYVPAGSTFRAYISMPSVTPVPSSDQNYIMRAKVKVPGITTESALNSVLNDKSKVEVTIQYFDGLGRQMQTVQQQGSPSGNDVIQPVFYDSLSRETKQYLPYVPTSTANGAYRNAAVSDQQSFYNSPPAGVISIPSGSGQVAYSQTQFEASPLNRVLQQGFPGGDWKIGGGHTQRQGYGINGANEVRIWKVTSNGATGTTYFPKARLYTDTLTDEDGYKTITYTDYDKKVRLKRVQDASGYLSTYYVYDDLNNLRYVLPPGFTAASFTESDTAFDQFVYAYHYNGKRQVTEKKIPGKGWEYMVYNRIDRMVMSQDANQRAKAPQEWTIFKYDELGRLVLTGIYSHTGSSAGTSYRSAQQGAVDANSNFWESSLSTGTGYTANTYPTSWDRTLTINYFDTYVIPGKNNIYDATQTVSTRTQGLATGSKVNVLGTSTMLLTVNYYDEHQRLKESISDNHLSGTDRTVNTWNFADELIASTRTHISNPIPGGMTIANRYEYDHMGRKIKTYEKIGSDTEVTLSELNYNELGQVYTKNQGGGKQTTTYSYNSRGWLTGKSAPLFAMQLKYNDGTVPRYNGNITNQLWGTPGNLSNTFSYSYDPLSRLTSGDTGTGTYEKDIAYDVMGNITSLNRNGTGTQSYSYNGNRLSSVTGGISRSYTYDANGNALTDGTNTLTYNDMNLPATVSGGAAITYTYDALGRKLRSVNGGVTKDYISGIQYTGGVLDFIQTEEGLARKNGSNYSYEYNLTDHLGNNRLSFDIYSNAAREIQHDSYLPFGKTYNSYTLGTRNNYLYNGKQLQDGFGQYDYGARFYDPEVGRWNVPDPMAESDEDYSPYNYTRNNPVKLIDPDGMYWEEAFAGIMIGLPYEGEDWVLGKNKIPYWNDAVTSKTDKDLKPSETYIGKSGEGFTKEGYTVQLHSDKTWNYATYELPPQIQGPSIAEAVRANMPMLNLAEGIATGTAIVASGAIGATETAGSFLLNGVGRRAAFMEGLAENTALKTGTELFNFSAKAAEHMANSDRAVPVQILEQAIKGSRGIVDPRGSSALLHTIEMWKNGTPYNLEVLYNEATNAIWHFKYFIPK